MSNSNSVPLAPGKNLAREECSLSSSMGWMQHSTQNETTSVRDHRLSVCSCTKIGYFYMTVFERAFSSLRLQDAGWLQSWAVQLICFTWPVWKVHHLLIWLTEPYILLFFQMNLSKIRMEFSHSYIVPPCICKKHPGNHQETEETNTHEKMWRIF